MNHGILTILKRKNKGLNVRLNKMTITPTSTSFYLKEIVHPNLLDETWETVIVDYEITDDSGNEYTVVSNGASGNNEYVSAARVIAKNLDEE